jgi:hypothetical protein
MFIIPTRKVILAALKTTQAVTALVPATQILPQTQPEKHGWPFIRWDGPTSFPYKGVCVNGAQVSFMVHAFAKPVYDGPDLKRMVETAEDHCGRILEAIEPVLSGNRFESAGRSFRVRVTSTALMRDRAEADAYHGLLNCVARVLA